MATPYINGKAYAWSDINLNLLGRTVEEITAITYGLKQNKKSNYGRGTEPKSYANGNKEYEASITLSLKEVQAITGSLPVGKSLVDIGPFDIPVVFAGEDNILVTHVLKSCQFMENKIDTKQGDTSIDIPLPLLIGGIEGL